MRLVRGLHVLVSWTLAVPVTIAFALAEIVVALLAPRSHLQIALLRGWARTLLILAGFRLRIEGRDIIDTEQRFVIMANHASRLDIPTLLVALPAALDVRFLAKRSLFRIPFLGWAMRAVGFVAVDRDDTSTAPDVFAAARDLLARDRSVLVFPEATTTRDATLLPFRRGGFLLALKSHVAVLPVGLAGTARGLPIGRLAFHPGQLTVRFGTPIATEPLSVRDREALMERVRAEIDDLRQDRDPAAP